MEFIAVGTARNAGKLVERAAWSCASQGIPYIMVDASEELSDIFPVPGFSRVLRPQSNGLANVRYLTSMLQPDVVCLWLDGDDELLPGAVSRVRAEYDPYYNTQLTYGSFLWYRNGKRDDSTLWNASQTPKEVVQNNAYRQDVWRATHLKTFKAGLFQAIPDSYLQWPNGEWLTSAFDTAAMLAMLELSGGRFSYIPSPLYRYNYGAVPQDPEILAKEQETVAYVRSLPPLSAL